MNECENELMIKCNNGNTVLWIRITKIFANYLLLMI